MIITDKFYEDEVREGFYVPASVKQAWGATLMVLGEIDRICKKYNIPFYISTSFLLNYREILGS